MENEEGKAIILLICIIFLGYTIGATNYTNSNMIDTQIVDKHGVQR